MFVRVSCVSTRGPRAWMHGSLAAARRRSLPLTIACNGTHDARDMTRHRSLRT